MTLVIFFNGFFNIYRDNRCIVLEYKPRNFKKKEH